jgi:hypothetical protein
VEVSSFRDYLSTGGVLGILAAIPFAISSWRREARRQAAAGKGPGVPTVRGIALYMKVLGLGGLVGLVVAWIVFANVVP